MAVRFYLCEVDKENVLQTSAAVKRLVADFSVLVEEEKNSEEQDGAACNEKVHQISELMAVAHCTSS